MSGARSFRERLALISGVDLEQLDGLEGEDREEFEPNLARLASHPGFNTFYSIVFFSTGIS
jgi:hypothetical protein